MATQAQTARKVEYRKPNEVNLFCFYGKLWDLINKRTKGAGVQDRKQAPFTRKEIFDALADQVGPDNAEAAIQYCLGAGHMLESEGGRFSAPSRPSPTITPCCGASDHRGTILSMRGGETNAIEEHGCRGPHRRR